MKLSPNLTPLNIVYPTTKQIPKNLLNTPIAEQFVPESKLIPFREQFTNESHPHTIKHMHYQFGSINKRRAVKFYYKKKPYRLVYSSAKDAFAEKLMNATPPRTKFPPTTVSSPIARSLREFALKWIVEEFFSKIGYMSFDEPILDGVNPDCFIIPSNQANKVLDLNHNPVVDERGLTDVELKDAIFVEIKAYHQSSLIGEKEVLQSFNYAVKGRKAMLITTGTYGKYDSFNILNNSKNIQNHQLGEDYDPEVYEDFVQAVKNKSRKLIKKIDMGQGQDSFDTRGIYISAGSKLKKTYKYTSCWPNKITYVKLETPEAIKAFLSSDDKLGLVEPDAFWELLNSQKQTKLADLFKRIQQLYLEEIIINPTLLYPK
ncbi:hypothetical protein [Candidatus Lokiarchaeum ossiferum]|uniref:hypothetical protein n=1 Tax=Candidatus Lokiarchaeum ossiferum TaxID=2951803 RepID=UPI00352F3902